MSTESVVTESTPMGETTTTEVEVNESQSYDSIANNLMNEQESNDSDQPETESESKTDEEIINEIRNIGKESEENQDTEEVDETKKVEDQPEDAESKIELADVELNGKSYQIPSELKDSFLMQSDYTKKTQELADERKTFEESTNKAMEDLEKSYQEHNEIINEYKQWEYYFSGLETSNPDMFEELKADFAASTKHFDNPVVKQVQQQNELLKKQVEEMGKKFENAGKERESSIIWDNYLNDMTELTKTLGPKLEGYGLKIDLINDEKIRSEFMNGFNDETLKGITTKEAVYRAYGQAIVAAVESKQKTNTAKKVINSKKKTPTVGNFNRSSGTPAPTKNLSYDQLERQILSKI